MFSISTQFNCQKPFYIKLIMQFNAIWPIDRTLSGGTTPRERESGPVSDGNEGVLRIPQSSRITGTLPLDF